MKRVPLLTGTRVQVLSAPDDAVVLVPPAPRDAITDVNAAVREALRYPLSGQPLRRLATRGGRATILVEPPALPIPGSELDPRRRAIDAASAELEQAGIPSDRQTLLVAGGLARRVEARHMDGLVTPGFARRFSGSVVVHDVEDPALVELSPGVRVNPALVETDAVVVVTAAQTFLHGGPATLLAAAGVEALRAVEADSLLETRNSRGWRLALELERLVERRTALIGVSLALNHPRLDAAVQGYPYDADALERVASSPLRRLFSMLPGPVRQMLLHSLKVDLTVSTAYAGPPSVAHVEALLRSIEIRSASLDEPVEAIVVPVPRTTPYLPRERPNPVLAANLALGYALRLWRDSFPVAEGGTAILVHRFHRAFAHPTQAPYRAFFGAARLAREPDVLAAAEREACLDERALGHYRAGRSCHPALPFADWDACQPALRRLGTVLVAGCRDATAARQLGFVPTGSISAALDMATGTLGREPRLGVLVTPPFFPIRVGA